MHPKTPDEQQAANEVSHRFVLDEATIRLVQETHALVHCIAGTAGTIFYMYLFEQYPQVCTLFMEDINILKLKYMTTLRSMVNALDQPHSLTILVQQLAQQTITCCVLVEHTDEIEAALVRSLHIALGPAFTAEVRAAWVAAYRCVVALIGHAHKALECSKKCERRPSGATSITHTTSST